MKVSELTGAKLDYWVGKAEGLNVEIGPHGECMLLDEAGDEICDEHFPSTDWSKGGPVIEREKIKIEPVHALRGGEFRFWNAKALKYIFQMDGETALIAAMRCFVASKFGEDVPDE